MQDVYFGRNQFADWLILYRRSNVVTGRHVCRWRAAAWSWRVDGCWRCYMSLWHWRCASPEPCPTGPPLCAPLSRPARSIDESPLPQLCTTSLLIVLKYKLALVETGLLFRVGRGIKRIRPVRQIPMINWIDSLNPFQLTYNWS